MGTFEEFGLMRGLLVTCFGIGVLLLGLGEELSMQPASFLSLCFFCGLSIGHFSLLILGLRRYQVPRLWGLGFVGITLLVSLFAMTGLTAKFPIPLAPLLMLLILVFAVLLAGSKAGYTLSQKVSFLWLIGLQAVRLPLELILHAWTGSGTIPDTMTWTGSNIDIVSGIVALLFLPLIAKNEKWVWIPQVVGFVLLLNVLRVVILSSPFPFSWSLEIPLELIMHFPYALIAPIFVLPAFVLHLLTFRKLLPRQPE